MTRRFQFN